MSCYLDFASVLIVHTDIDASSKRYLYRYTLLLIYCFWTFTTHLARYRTLTLIETKAIRGLVPGMIAIQLTTSPAIFSAMTCQVMPTRRSAHKDRWLTQFKATLSALLQHTCLRSEQCQGKALKSHKPIVYSSLLYPLNFTGTPALCRKAMDPATALAITGLIVQVVDIGWKVAKYCRTVFVDGSTKSQNDAQEYAATLTTSCTNLQQSLNGLTTRHPNRADQELLEIASKCLQTGKELGVELAHATSGPDRGIKAVVQHVAYSMRHAGNVKKLRLQLSDYQRLLDTKYLESQHKTAKEILDNQKDFFEAQSLDLQYMISRLASGFTETDALFMSEARQIRDDVKAEHQSTRKSVLDAINTAMQKLDAERQCEMVCSSLEYDDMSDREMFISGAQEGTFKTTILGDSIGDGSLSFSDWHLSNDQVYWIEGKPGSGKSTLMKFLAKSQRVRDVLAHERSLANENVVILKYFGWIGGSTLQRNTYGLLRNLLHQLFTQDRELLVYLIRSEGNRFPKSFEDRDSLLSLLQKAMIHCTWPAIAFVDGLDEFVEDSKSLTHWLNNLCSVNMRFCFASRPDNSFNGHFEHIPRLRLQDLTRPDLCTVVLKNLSQNEGIQALLPSGTDEYENLASLTWAIVDKAEGVFLWVTLAVREIVAGIEEYQDWNTLYKILDRIPPELEDVYRRKWKILSPECSDYCEQATELFQFAMYSGMLLFEAAVILFPEPCYEVLEQVQQESQEELNAKCGKAEKRILPRCQGLLEVVCECRQTQVCRQSGLRYQHHQVEYIHRTARDFVENALKVNPLSAVKSRIDTWTRYMRLTSVMRLLDPAPSKFRLRGGESLPSAWSFLRPDRSSTTLDPSRPEDLDSRMLDTLRELTGIVERRESLDVYSSFSVAREFYGAAAEMGYSFYTHRHLSRSWPVEVNTLNYFLLCAVHTGRLGRESRDRKVPLDHSLIRDLLERGASFTRNWIPPPSYEGARWSRLTHWHAYLAYLLKSESELTYTAEDEPLDLRLFLSQGVDLHTVVPFLFSTDSIPDNSELRWYGFFDSLRYAIQDEGIIVVMSMTPLTLLNWLFVNRPWYPPLKHDHGLEQPSAGPQIHLIGKVRIPDYLSRRLEVDWVSLPEPTDAGRLLELVRKSREETYVFGNNLDPLKHGLDPEAHHWGDLYDTIEEFVEASEPVSCAIDAVNLSYSNWTKATMDEFFAMLHDGPQPLKRMLHKFQIPRPIYAGYVEVPEGDQWDQTTKFFKYACSEDSDMCDEYGCPLKLSDTEDEEDGDSSLTKEHNDNDDQEDEGVMDADAGDLILAKDHTSLPSRERPRTS